MHCGPAVVIALAVAVGAEAFMVSIRDAQLGPVTLKKIHPLRKGHTDLRPLRMEAEKVEQGTVTRKLAPSFGEAMRAQDFCGVIVPPKAGSKMIVSPKNAQNDVDELIQKGYAALKEGRPQEGIVFALRAIKIIETLLTPPGDTAKADELERKCTRVKQLYTSGEQAFTMATTVLGKRVLAQARSECDRSIKDYDAALELGAADLGQPARSLLIQISAEEAAEAARRAVSEAAEAARRRMSVAGLIQQGYAALKEGQPQKGLDFARQASSIIKEFLALPGDTAKADELERKCIRVQQLYASGEQAFTKAKTALGKGALDQARSECNMSIKDYDAALELGAADLGQPARSLLISIDKVCVAIRFAEVFALLTLLPLLFYFAYLSP